MSISDAQREFYQRLYSQHGNAPQALSARDGVTHDERFQRTARLLDRSAGTDIHEIGCGLGHFGRWLAQHAPQAQYSGSDICPEFVDSCREQFPDAAFNCQDICETPLSSSHDWVVLVGVFNIRLQRPDAEWFTFVQSMMRAMYAACRTGISVDFLTPYSDPDKRRDDLYYQPLEPLLDFVSSDLSRHFEIDHSAPLYEYTLRVHRPEAIRERHSDTAFDRYFKGGS